MRVWPPTRLNPGVASICRLILDWVVTFSEQRHLGESGMSGTWSVFGAKLRVLNFLPVIVGAVTGQLSPGGWGWSVVFAQPLGGRLVEDEMGGDETWSREASLKLL